jgi:hypothetical protein
VATPVRADPARQHRVLRRVAGGRAGPPTFIEPRVGDRRRSLSRRPGQVRRRGLDAGGADARDRRRSVDPDIAGTYPFADAIAGLEIAEIAPILRDVAPHPVAEASRPADPAERYAATIEQNSPATTSPPTPVTATTAT